MHDATPDDASDDAFANAFADAIADDRAELLRLARRLLGTREAAEDAVQEALLRHVERFGPEGEGVAPDSSRAWLARVTRNLAIDRLRRARLERETRLAGRLPEPEGDDEGPDETFARRERCRRVVDTLLGGSDPRDAAAVLLREAFGVGYADIARGSGRSAAAWRQSVRRALERARDGTSRERAGGEHERGEIDHDARIADGVLERFERAVFERDPAVLFDALRVDARGGMTIAAPAVPVREHALARRRAGVPPTVRVVPNARGAWIGVELDAYGARLSLVLDGRVLCRLPAQRSSARRGIASSPHQRSAFCS